MRFSIFTTVRDSAGEATNALQLLDYLREQVILAEDLGFDAI